LAWLWPGSGAVTALPEIDGLRALAVLLVVFFHSWWIWPDRWVHGYVQAAYPIGNAWTGVHLFFVLSGFLLFQPYARWLFGIGAQPSTRLFYTRRLLRVAPAYWVSLLIVVALGPITLAALGDLLLHGVYLSNLTNSTTYSINGVYWTMAVEVQFYALLPGLALLMRRLTPRLSPVRAVAAVTGGMVLVSAICMMLLQRRPILSIPVVGSTLVGNAALPYWIGIFGIGMACGALYVYVQQIWQPDEAQREQLRTFCTRGVIAALIVVTAVLLLKPLQDFSALDLLFGVVYAALLLGVLFGIPALGRVFQTPTLRFIGLISYSIYIWHYAVMHALVPLLAPISQQPQRVLITAGLDLLISLPVAYISFRLTEKPFLNLRRQAHEKAPAAAAAARS
jgi:peptidoglycan/LPS O-acetylase OafA/YrhL